MLFAATANFQHIRSLYMPPYISIKFVSSELGFNIYNILFLRNATYKQLPLLVNHDEDRHNSLDSTPVFCLLKITPPD